MPAAAPAELSLSQLRQLFFDQPRDLAGLRQRCAALQQTRATLPFADGGALWDELLGNLRRYIGLLEQREAQQAAAAAAAGEPPAAAPAAEPQFVPTCGMCQQPGSEANPLQRMQPMGTRQHVAVCADCRRQRLGLLIPLTPMWQLDEAAWVAIRQAQAGGGGRGRGRGRGRGSQGGRGSRGGRGASDERQGNLRPRAKFLATHRGWLKLLTQGNLKPTSSFQAPRIYLPCEPACGGARWGHVPMAGCLASTLRHRACRVAGCRA